MLLNYVVHANPTSHKDVLHKVKNFAVTQGWNIIDQQVSKEWLYSVSKYDWLAGNEDYVWLSSTGHGSQDINVRMRAWGTGGDAQHEEFDCYGIKPTDKTVNDQSATHPALQGNWTGSGGTRMSMSPGTSTKLWIFGNSWFICAINQLASDFFQCFCFGTIDLYDSAEDEMHYCLTSQYSLSSFPKWYNYQTSNTYFSMPFNKTGNDQGSNQYYIFLWNGQGYAQTYARLGTYFGTTDARYGNFNYLGLAVQLNQFTGKRTLIKPTIYSLHSLTDGLWRPAGTFPLYHIQFSGLQMGQELDYGGETYMCFPNCISSRKYGFAFRIA